MGWESSGVVGLDLGPLLQGQTRIAKVKSAYNSLIIDPRSLQYETNSYEILGQEFSDVRFDLWPLLQCQTVVSLALVSCLFGGYKFASVSDV